MSPSASKVEELVEVVEHALEFADQRVHAAAADVRRQLGRERGLAHVAQQREAAGGRGLLDVAFRDHDCPSGSRNRREPLGMGWGARNACAGRLLHR